MTSSTRSGRCSRGTARRPSRSTSTISSPTCSSCAERGAKAKSIDRDEIGRPSPGGLRQQNSAAAGRPQFDDECNRGDERTERTRTDPAPENRHSPAGLGRWLRGGFGPGIDAEDVERIFDALFTTKSKGMGMGLSIRRSIIEKLPRRAFGYRPGRNMDRPFIRVAGHGCRSCIELCASRCAVWCRVIANRSRRPKVPVVTNSSNICP